MRPVLTSPLRRFLLGAGLSFLFILSWSAQTFACACCADHGERHEGVVPLADYTRDVLTGLKFANEANLYVTDAGWETIRGINKAAQSDTYRLKVKLKGKDWTFSFDDRAGNKGALKFASGSTVEQFAVDTKPQMPGGAGYVSVKLYKEWTIKNVVTQSGIFMTPVNGVNTVRLILHGRGNGCSDPTQFTNWTLDVWHQTPGQDNGKLQYRFFGKLISGQ